MKQRLTLLLVFAMLLSFVFTVEAGTYTASVASFKVTLNGVEIEHQNSLYPLLVYKSITYFPMTYDFTSYLGLSCEFDSKEGLRITSGFSSSAGGLELDKNTKNPKQVKAVLPTYKITVNDRVVDNTKEVYPVLNYNGITYFPMTWSFVHEDFKWKLHFDQTHGLTVWSICSIDSILGTDEENYYFSLYHNKGIGVDLSVNEYSLIVKTSKTLAGPWLKCSVEEIEKIKSAQPYYNDYFPSRREESVQVNIAKLESQGLKVSQFDEERIMLKGSIVYKDNKELLNLDEFIESHPEYYSENSKYSIRVGGYNLGDDLEVAVLYVSYNQNIPPPYTPGKNILLINYKGKDIISSGTTILNNLRFINNKDGSWYIIELPFSVRASILSLGNVYHLSSEGVLTNYIRAIQEEYGLDGFHPKTLMVTDDGDVYFCSYYHPLFSNNSEWDNMLVKANGDKLETVLTPDSNLRDVYVTENGDIVYTNASNEIKVIKR